MISLGNTEAVSLIFVSRQRAEYPLPERLAFESRLNN